MNFLDNFRLSDEKEDFKNVSEIIWNGIDFKGTNLWILIFAVMIASLGLNVNSTAVIIGAMLVSPLMGPIMGLGFGMAVNDLVLIKRAFFSYLFAAVVGLATSTLYFLLSPINDAHSEILARTAPNIYDVLIAFFGGLAGMLATSSRLKGNVIPGVAIATALMPPLCTAGYGLATLQFQFFFGAFYLFLINTVFIALATNITAKFLNFPYKHLPEKKDEVRAQRIVWLVVLLTLLPSIYFGYDIVRKNKFQQRANRFIENEANFPNDYLLKKSIDAKSRSITLTYGGQQIEEPEIAKLKSRLPQYDLLQTKLEILQGFAYLKENKENEQTLQLSMTLREKGEEIQALQHKLDSLNAGDQQGKQLFSELIVQYPQIHSFSIHKTREFKDTIQRAVLIAVIHAKPSLGSHEKKKIEAWLRVRLQQDAVECYYDNANP